MLLLIILAVIAVLGFYIASKAYDDIAQLLSISVGVVAIDAWAFFFILALIVHNDFIRERRLTEYEEQYKAVAYSCQVHPENTVILSKEIAEYNSDVLEGRLAMDNFWLSFFDYDFYYDLPLIETE